VRKHVAVTFLLLGLLPSKGSCFWAEFRRPNPVSPGSSFFSRDQPADRDDSGWKDHLNEGDNYREKGNYSEAEKAYLAAIKEAEAFAEQDPRLPMTMNNLASLYDEEGRYREAEPLYLRALNLREKFLRRCTRTWQVASTTLPDSTMFKDATPRLNSSISGPLPSGKQP
jgi:tetratricopeptide (TPR) repeat protein